MPMMPGMDMSAGAGAMMICPMVLGLIVTSALLALAAIVTYARDPHRALQSRTLANALAQLPPARTAIALLGGGTSAVAAMMWLEHSAPALPECALLVALLVLCSSIATLCAIVAGRMALALGRRLVLAIVAAIAGAAQAAAPRAQSFAPLVAASHAVPLLASGRGLRAPPDFVR
jgi:MFS family permease